jgi:hypothetical protein
MAGSKRNPKSQNEHDKAVKMFAKQYERNGWDVQAELPGYKKPPSIEGHRPDIRATKGNQESVMEVETGDSVNTPHATAQDAAFRKLRQKGANYTRRTV